MACRNRLGCEPRTSGGKSHVLSVCVCVCVSVCVWGGLAPRTSFSAATTTAGHPASSLASTSPAPAPFAKQLSSLAWVPGSPKARILLRESSGRGTCMHVDTHLCQHTCTSIQLDLTPEACARRGGRHARQRRGGKAVCMRHACAMRDSTCGRAWAAWGSRGQGFWWLEREPSPRD